MDIPHASCVTITSNSSIESLHKDFSNKTADELRLRFRANIELGGVPAFWEESLVQDPGVGIRFKIGDVEMIGVSPRARCNVPPRDPFTGVTDNQFVKQMMKSRENSLPVDSLLPKYGNTYHLTLNTYIPESEMGKWIKVGDLLKLIGPVNLGNLYE